MKKPVLILFLIFLCYKASAQVTAKFNFSNEPATVSGWTNVSGQPYQSVITATGSGSIAVSSVATANWGPYNGVTAHNGAGYTGPGFFPAGVLTNHWFNWGTGSVYSSSKWQLEITGLDATKKYRIKISGSYTPTNVDLDPVEYRLSGAALTGPLTMNGHNPSGTSGVTFDNIFPESGTNRIKIYINSTTGNAATGSDCGNISGLEISEILPEVLAVTPAQGSTLVSIGATVLATFSEAINGATVTSSTFQLKDAANNVIPAVINASSNQISLTPSSALGNTTVYTATIKGGSSGVKNLTGSALASDYSWSFTTASTNSSGWTLSGNTGTNPSTNFIGTTDNQRLVFRTNNTERLTIDNAGNVGMGTSIPAYKLDVNGSVRVSGNLYLPSTSGTNGMIYFNNLPFIHSQSTNSVFVGENAGINSTGPNNIGVGRSTLIYNQAGESNTAVGHAALGSNSSGSYNASFGFSALNSNTTGNYSVAVGPYSLESTNTVTNTAVGALSGRHMTSGSGNSLFGYATGASNNSGNFNSYFGHAIYNPGVGNLNGSNNTVVGANVLNAGAADNNTVIGANVSVPTTNNNIIIADGQGNHRIRVFNTGNTAIGYPNNVEDGGYKFDVNGAGRYINTTGSSPVLDVVGAITTGLTIFRLQNTSVTGGTGMRFLNESGTGKAQFFHGNSSYSLGADRTYLDAQGIGGLELTARSGNLDLNTQTVGVANAKMRLFNNGNVAIGTNPVDAGYKLDVVGNIRSSTGLHTSGSVRFGGLTTDNAQTKVLVTDANGNVFNRDISTISSSSSSYWTASGSNDIVNLNVGNIGIGTNPQSAYKLVVNGVIGARKVKVTAETWADYVFEKEYHLPTLQEVEQFIQRHKHLPDMPSAREVAEKGLDIGDNQALLLKKIEELTLYMIELNKEVKRLSAENELLKKKIKH